MRRQTNSMVMKKFKSRRLQCASKSRRLQRLYLRNCRQQAIGTRMCKYFIGKNRMKVTIVVIKPKVVDRLFVMLMVILMTYATILMDLMVNITSNALVMTVPGYEPSAASKTLHQNHKIIIFLIFQPKRMMRKCGFICDHRFRRSNTVNSKIITPARQILSKTRQASEQGQRVAQSLVFYITMMIFLLGQQATSL